VIARVLLVLLVLACAPRLALAHGFNHGVLALHERADHRFDVAWTAPIDTASGEVAVEPHYPRGCTLAGALLACDGGLEGDITFPGLTASRAQVVVMVQLLDGRRVEGIATPSNPAVAVHAGQTSGVVQRWIRTGFEHVLTGLDHVAFVIGLFLVVGARRRLIATVTAFTVAHSVTLALAATGVVNVARAPVEASIAVSVLLVASEALHDRPTVTRTRPSVVAFLFGLVHGLGFAGALSELGLPRAALGRALVSFNVGVELAQLAIVGALFLLSRITLAGERATKVRRATCYVLGAAGAYWLFDRTLMLLTSRS